MSRELDFDGWWQGTVIYSCDRPRCRSEELFKFDDEEEAYSQEFIRELRERKGWITTKVNGRWVDFCCEACRNAYISMVTK